MLAHNLAAYRDALASIADRGWVEKTGGHRWADTRGPAAYCARCGLGYPHWGGDPCPGPMERGEPIRAEVAGMMLAIGRRLDGDADADLY